MSAREQWLDITKGFAILLVVIGHALRGFTTAGMYPEYSNVFHYIDYTLYSFHMPLFFMISGYLYAKKEQLSSIAQWGGYIRKKLVRLGIPYVVFSLLQGLLHLLTNHHTNHTFETKTLLLLLWQPFDQFWFLYTLIAIFIGVSLLDLATKKDGLILALLLALKLVFLNIYVHIPAVDLFFANAIYFYIGAVVARHYANGVLKPAFLLTGAASYLLLNVWFYHSQATTAPLNTAQSWIELPLALTGCVFALFIVQQIIPRIPTANAVFNKLGLYSFEIYLLHTMVSASGRMFLSKVFHIQALLPHLVAGIGLATLIPMLIAILIQHYPLLSFSIYPDLFLRHLKAHKKMAYIPS